MTLVRWEEDDAYLPSEAQMFDRVIVLRRRECLSGASLLACNVRNMLHAVSIGVQEATRLGATHIFRVRIDLLVQMFQLPAASEGHPDDCVFAHTNKHWGVSDNVLWASTGSMASLFAEEVFLDDRYYNHPEALMGKRLEEHGLRPCYVPFSVWLAKPDNAKANARQPDPSKGLRHWWSARPSVNGSSSYQEGHLVADLPSKLLPNVKQRAACGLGVQPAGSAVPWSAG